MSATVAARKILTGLHELMATRLSAQDKLDRTVEIVGESLDSEVCSIYLLRGGMLELSATRGLNQSAVHVTRLAVGAKWGSSGRPGADLSRLSRLPRKKMDGGRGLGGDYFNIIILILT